jgi:hypothetical protein
VHPYDAAGRVYFILIALALAAGLSYVALGANISTTVARSPGVQTNASPQAKAASGGKQTHTVAAGDIVYWSPGPDVAIIYRHAGPGIPDPGDIVLATISSGMKAFDVPGSVRVRIERAR